MNSKDLILKACDISTTSSLFLSDKETQTSALYLDSATSKISRTRPVPVNIEAVARDDNVKVFEYCEIIEDPNDPKSVTTIKETFTEEVLTDSDCPFDGPTKNKYKYCKEIIQPFSTTPSKDCPFYPKCMHKTECCPKNRDNLPSDQEKAMNCDKCKKTFVNPNKPPDNCAKKEETKPCCCPNDSAKKEKPPCDNKPDKPVCRKAEPFDECTLKKCISACLNESLKMAKEGTANCKEKFEKVIGVRQPKDCTEKPTYYVMEKSKSDSSTSTVPEKNSMQSIFDNQSQTVANITCAIKGFMGAVYNKTKDAVNMIKTESCRHLGLNDDPKPAPKENKTEQKPKECSSKVAEMKTESLYERFINETDKTEVVSESYSVERILEPAKEAIDHVASVVASTVSVLKNSSFEKIVDDILDGKVNKSSIYDEPDDGKRTPKKIAQDHEPGSNSSVFTMIKAKILSIFDIQQDTCQDDVNDDDDDDSSAEKLFDKYCEQ